MIHFITYNDRFFFFSIGTTDSEPPNIIILLADDMGSGDLGVSGHPTSLTPKLDKLAASSLHLTSFYVASPVCSPSRASLLTGKYPVSTGIWPKVVQPNSVGGLDPASHIKEYTQKTFILAICLTLTLSSITLLSLLGCRSIQSTSYI